MTKYKKTFFATILICFLVAGGWVWNQYQDIQGPGIPVLLYHGVDIQEQKNKYTLETEVFEQQLRWLKKKGYSTILPRDIKGRSWTKNPQKKVMLTFDDGRANNYKVVFPLLQKYGFQGVFFIVSGVLGEKDIMSPQQLKEISDQGMEVGSHTVTHPYLDTLDERRVKDQLLQSKENLESITGKQVLALAPPGGWFDHRTEVVAQRQGYDFLFSCEIGLNDLTQKPFVYKRIEVLRDMPLAEFQNLLTPSEEVFTYKVKQSLKFALHALLGTDNYVKLGRAL